MDPSKGSRDSKDALGRRRWLADEPLRLLPLYSEPPRTPTQQPRELQFLRERPTVLLRASRIDVKGAPVALEILNDAAALVVNLTEQRSTIGQARRVAMQHAIPLIGDPILYRMALADHVGSPGSRRLRYRPPDGQGPWTARELREHAPQISRLVIEEQYLSGAKALYGAAVAIAGPQDPSLGSVAPLLDGSLAARQAWGENAALLAPLILAPESFASAQALDALEQALGKQTPDSWLLLLDSITMASRAQGWIAAARIIARLRAKGTAVSIARAGPARRLWFALADGIELGLGRLERFALDDYRSARSGPGNNPPRWECPELLCSLPQSLAAPLLASGLVGECACVGCTEATSVVERLARAPLHNASVVQGDVEQVAGHAATERLSMLEAQVRNARALAFDLDTSDTRLRRQLAHLDTWPTVIAELREESLVGERAA